MEFAEVIGQQEARDELQRLADSGRVPHAMLFTGPAGCGKMALALALASRLLGNSPMLRNWAHPDLHFSFPTIKPANASGDYKPKSDDFITQWRHMLASGPYFTLDQWMNEMGAANQQAVITVGESAALEHKLGIKSSQHGYKVSIMWLPERMNADCANKLLKLIEEPPSQTVFILVSEEPERIIGTIRSRTQRFDFRKIDDESLARALVERRGIEAETASRMAHVANGNWNKALEELSADGEKRTFLDLFIQLMRLSWTRDVRGLKKWSDDVADRNKFGREKQKRMLTYFLHMVRESFVYNFRRPELCYMTQAEENFAKNFARFVNEANVVDIAAQLSQAIREISQNANARIVFFDLTLNMIVLIKNGSEWVARQQS